jgi:hypothetical protein
MGDFFQKIFSAELLAFINHSLQIRQKSNKKNSRNI